MVYIDPLRDLASTNVKQSPVRETPSPFPNIWDMPVNAENSAKCERILCFGAVMPGKDLVLFVMHVFLCQVNP